MNHLKRSEIQISGGVRSLQKKEKSSTIFIRCYIISFITINYILYLYVNLYPVKKATHLGLYTSLTSPTRLNRTYNQPYITTHDYPCNSAIQRNYRPINLKTRTSSPHVIQASTRLRPNCLALPST